MVYKSSDIRKLGVGFHNFGDSLYLKVTATSRSWVARVTDNGKRTWRGLGSVESLPLGEARIAARAKRLNPTKEEKQAPTNFKEVAELAFPHIKELKQWKTERQAMNHYRRLEMYAYPAIGSKAITKITHNDIVALVQAIYFTRTETAKMLVTILGYVFDFAITRGYYQGNNPALWRGNLSAFFPPQHKIAKTRHHESLSWQEIPQLANILYTSADVSSLCLLFGILTATRLNEFYGAKWEEFDFENHIWSIPPERRKDGKDYPHRVPLTKATEDIVLKLPRKTAYVFRNGNPISTFSVRKRAKAYKPELTIHGFRSSFRDWCAETGKDFVASEKALCHAVGSAVTQAYLRSDLLETRRPLMEEWSCWCLSISVCQS